MFVQQSFDYHQFTNYAFALSRLPHTIWLDSNDVNHQNSEFSFVVSCPYFLYNNNNDNDDDNFFDSIRRRPEFNLFNHQTNHFLPFTGGFVGYFGYDALVRQRFNIDIPMKKSTSLPPFYGGLYDVVLYAHHPKQQAGIVAIPVHPTEKPQERINLIMKLASRGNDYSYQSVQTISKINYDNPYLKQDYEDAVFKTIDFIKQGDIFQANITRMIQLSHQGIDALALYSKLRNVNASPFAAYVNGGDNFQILSASPERFLKIHHRKIISEPIKGTIRQSLDSKEDMHQKEILQNCPKNRAENVMITDLLRNDISPFAKTGTITVEKLCELQTYKGLHHLVSKVSAEMKDDAHACDVLKFALPGGSITGAPKKRVCEIIYELEKQQRSTYCGSLGYIGFNGNCDMNILIRTLEIDNNHITFNAGCGITSLSDPTEEYDETLVKIAKIIESLSE